VSEDKHIFRLTSEWSGPSTGDGRLDGDGYALEYGLPESLGGSPGRSNPEEMLLGAVAACYSMTFAILAERRKLAVSSISVGCEAEVVKQPGGTLKYVSITLRPVISMSGADEAQVKSATDFAHKAEQYCVISNAIRGSVEVRVEPEIQNAP
jgi:peroxiredoxin-like protein